MRKAGAAVVAIFTSCAAVGANQSREQKRLEACGQVFKEIMDIPDGIPKDLLNKAECDPSVAIVGWTPNDPLAMEAPPFFSLTAPACR